MQMPQMNGQAGFGGVADQASIMGTLKIPPAWDSRWQRFYPFKQWSRNVVWWALACELPDQAQGAAVILRLGGVARELVGTLEPHVVRDGGVRDMGDGMGARQVTGLAIILRGLHRQFAPLDVETSTSSIAELMSFRRMPGEDIDTTLGRFASLQFKAGSEGNLDLGPGGFAWLLLTGLRIPPAEWVNLLIGFQGNLPVNDGQFNDLVGLIRRVGHVHQHGGIASTAAMAGQNQGMMGGPPPMQRGQGNFYFPTMAGSDPWTNSDPWSDGSLTIGGAPTAAYPVIPGYQQQQVPHMPFMPGGTSEAYVSDYDDWSSSGTSGQEAPQEELEAYLSNVDPSMRAETLWQDFLVTRRRWRTFTKKFTRYDRRHHRKGKGKGRSSSSSGKGFHGNGKGFAGASQASSWNRNYYDEQVPPPPVPHYAFDRKGAGKRRTNPKGADGQVLRCHGCGSDTHLIKDGLCPPKGHHHHSQASGAQQSFVGSMYTPQSGMLAGVPLPTTHYMTSQADDEREQIDNTHWSAVSVHEEDNPWSSYEGNTPAARTTKTARASPMDWSGTSDSGSAATVLPRTSPISQFGGMTMSTPNTPMDRQGGKGKKGKTGKGKHKALHDQDGQDRHERHSHGRHGTSDQAVRDLTSILSLGTPPPASSGAASAAASAARPNSTVQRAAQLFLPTYEQQGDKESRGTWHTRTRLGPKREGLLVDPGAHDNLTGDKWASRQEQLAQEAGIQTQYRPMREVLNVEGVGNGRQQCVKFGRFPIAMPAQEHE